MTINKISFENQDYKYEFEKKGIFTFIKAFEICKSEHFYVSNIRTDSIGFLLNKDRERMKLSKQELDVILRSLFYIF